MEIKVSLIIPVYNAEKYLGRCLDSLLQNTYQNFEMILVDDGSKDNSWAVIQEYVRKVSRKNTSYQTRK